MSKFALPDVSAENILGVARVAVNRDSMSPGADIDRVMVAQALSVSDVVAQRAILGATQIGFLSNADGRHTYSGDPELRHAKRSDLPLFLRKHLLSFPPFLIFLSQLGQEYDPLEAAAFTTAVLKIDSTPATAAGVLRRWGLVAGLVEVKSGILAPMYEPIKLLDLGFLSRLSASMEDAARVRTFVVDELGAELVADMSLRGVGDLPVQLADSLTRHEQDPRRIGDPVGSLIEQYCSTLFSTPVETNSLPDIANKLEERKTILRAHRNLLYGLAGFRHPASHGPDPRTQRPWTVTGRASLVGQLLALVTLRSIFLWTQAGRQEV